ncbi:unnamed protein product, partial [Schistosoma haematobium]
MYIGNLQMIQSLALLTTSYPLLVNSLWQCTPYILPTEQRRLVVNTSLFRLWTVHWSARLSSQPHKSPQHS